MSPHDTTTAEREDGARVILAGRGFHRSDDFMYMPVGALELEQRPLLVVNEAAPASSLAALLHSRAEHLCRLVNLLARSDLENSTPGEVIEVVAPLADEVRRLAEIVAEAAARREPDAA